MPSSATATLDRYDATHPQVRYDAVASGSTAFANRRNAPKQSYPSYPRGTWLCAEGSQATGVYIVHSGRVKETLSSADGKKLILRVLGPGQIVGLTAVLAGRPHEATAEALEITQAEFVSARDFLEMLHHSSQLSLSVVTQLGQNCKEAYEHLRRLAFPANITQRLACLIQQWAGHAAPGKAVSAQRFQITLTQEEIAQMVGSTRETVSRILMGFRRKGWIRIKGVTWFLTDPNAMLRLAEDGETKM